MFIEMYRLRFSVLLCLFCSRKRLTDWDTDITPLVGEELLVEVLDDIPLTMHNFVSSVTHTGICTYFTVTGNCQEPINLELSELYFLNFSCEVFLLFPLQLCRFGKHSSNWLTVISATSFCLTASGVKHVATNFTSTAAAKFLQFV